MKSRTTPDYITTLSPGEIFVFGSNLAGRHGAGAAKQAMKFGAQYGKARGPQGNTYAIPTKDYEIKYSLPLAQIDSYVAWFLDYTKVHPEKTFLVTEIGCGLAGLTTNQVAPMFASAVPLENVWLPKRFWEYLQF